MKTKDANDPRDEEIARLKLLLEASEAQVRVLQDTLVQVCSNDHVPRHSLGTSGQSKAPPRMTLKQVVAFAAMMEGLSNKDIQAILGTSMSTAKVHVRGVMKKLSAPTRNVIIVQWGDWWRSVSDRDFREWGGLPKTWVRDFDPDSGEGDPYIEAVRA